LINVPLSWMLKVVKGDRFYDILFKILIMQDSWVYIIRVKLRFILTHMCGKWISYHL